METLSSNIFGQVLATRAIVETLASFSALKPSFDRIYEKNEENDDKRTGTTLLMVLNGWVGVGKVSSVQINTWIMLVNLSKVRSKYKRKS